MERLTVSEQNDILGSGQSRFDNQVAWARFYLVKAGYLDSSVRGVWSLTEKGRNASLTHEQALAIFKEVRQNYSVGDEDTFRSTDITFSKKIEDEAIVPDDEDHRAILMKVLRDLPLDGFEGHV